MLARIPGLEGVYQGIDDSIEYHYGQRIPLVNLNLERNVWSRPLPCHNTSRETLVQGLNQARKRGWGMVVCQREVDQGVVDIAICVSQVNPTNC